MFKFYTYYLKVIVLLFFTLARRHRLQNLAAAVATFLILIFSYLLQQTQLSGCFLNKWFKVLFVFSSVNVNGYERKYKIPSARKHANISSHNFHISRSTLFHCSTLAELHSSQITPLTVFFPFFFLLSFDTTPADADAFCRSIILCLPAFFPNKTISHFNRLSNILICCKK